jgi:diacylglycerol kinase (ATP)
VNSNLSPSELNLVILAANPRAGTGTKKHLLAELADGLAQHGFTVETTSDLETLNSLVKSGTSSRSLRGVVACGGDGTVRLLADRLGASIPLTVFPMGTENLLAKHLEISTDIQKFCQMMVANRRIRFDAGRANGQLFLVMVSAGFDADVVRRLHSERRGPIRHTSYFGPLWYAIFGYRFPQMTLLVDDVEIEPARWAFIFNLPRYAMNLPLAPTARGDDGWLDLKAFPKGNFWHGLTIFFSVLLRRDERWAHSRHVLGKVFELTSRESVPYQIDGDVGGELPLRVEILPAYLELIAPRELVLTTE